VRWWRIFLSLSHALPLCSLARSSVPQINEALDLALEAIDRESSSKQEEVEDDEEETEEMEEEQQQINENKVNMEKEVKEKKAETETELRIAAMPNKTDEQKKKEEEEEQVEQQKELVQATVTDRKEPIYENVSSTISMQQVDNEETAMTTMIIRRSHRRSIPNKSNNNNNNNNNEHNQTNNNNNNNNNQNDTTTTTIQATTTAATTTTNPDLEPYYQVPKSTEPYYDAPKHLRPIPVYENIDIFYTGLEMGHNSITNLVSALEPPKEKPPPPPIETSATEGCVHTDDDELDAGTWSSDNTYETISSNTRRQLQSQGQSQGQGQVTPIAQPSPPIKRMNSTKRIKKELRNKRSSFLGIETDADLDDMDSYLELTVAPPPDMAQLLQEERRLEKQLYIKAGLCDSSDTGEFLCWREEVWWNEVRGVINVHKANEQITIEERGNNENGLWG